MELEYNNNRMGMRPRGKTWKWYTAKVTHICSIHIHNQTELWVYEIHTFSVLKSKEFDTKELAYKAAIKRLGALLEAAMEEIAEGI